MRPLLAFLSLAACSAAPSTGTDAATTVPAGEAASFAELAFFQAVKVPVLVEETPVPTADRTAPLVVGRDAVVRALVALPDGWTGDLTLAVDVTSGGTTETYTAAGAPELGLVVAVPGAAITADATFAARLTVGAATHDSYPASGEDPLDAIPTGPLAVHLVPFEVNGFVPDTSAAVVEGYRQALLATYPLTDATLTVGAVEPWAGAVDLGAINVRVGELQESAMFAGEAPWNQYWYGMVTGVATRDEFEGITGTSESGGDAPTRAFFAAGAAFGDQKSEDTLIHELGHTHGLLHTPCDGEDDPDPNYPYAGGVVGLEGYDRRTGTFVAADTFDLMAYCYPRWISDYSYAKLADRVAIAQDYHAPE